MGSLRSLAQDMVSHARHMKRKCGVEVVYQRTTDGILAAVNLTMWPGDAKLTRQNPDGVTMIQGDRCYLFLAADLYIGGQQVIPEKGDRVVQTIDGEDLTFEVMFDMGKPLKDFNDHTRQILRVWTKRVRPL